MGSIPPRGTSRFGTRGGKKVGNQRAGTCGGGAKNRGLGPAKKSWRHQYPPTERTHWFRRTPGRLPASAALRAKGYPDQTIGQAQNCFPHPLDNGPLERSSGSYQVGVESTCPGRWEVVHIGSRASCAVSLLALPPCLLHVCSRFPSAGTGPTYSLPATSYTTQSRPTACCLPRDGNRRGGGMGKRMGANRTDNRKQYYYIYIRGGLLDILAESGLSQ